MREETEGGRESVRPWETGQMLTLRRKPVERGEPMSGFFCFCFFVLLLLNAYHIPEPVPSPLNPAVNECLPTTQQDMTYYSHCMDE